MSYIADSRFQISHLSYRGEWNLSIKNVSLKDAGVYECQVSAKSRDFRRLILLNVVEILISGPTYVEIGQPFTLMCNATTEDFPMEDLDWFKDGSKIVQREDNQIEISKYFSREDKKIFSVLQKDHSILDDAGTYVCRTSETQVTGTKVHVLSGKHLKH
ncbi:hypothetical protein KUTeg_018206, partial [Tegillarca granosa]